MKIYIETNLTKSHDYICPLNINHKKQSKLYMSIDNSIKSQNGSFKKNEGSNNFHKFFFWVQIEPQEQWMTQTKFDSMSWVAPPKTLTNQASYHPKFSQFLKGRLFNNTFIHIHANDTIGI